MITLQEAVNIARKWNKDVDTCQEYKDAYEFYIDDGKIFAGGNHGCVVEKETGNVLRWHEYFMDLNRDIEEVGVPQRI